MNDFRTCEASNCFLMIELGSMIEGLYICDSQSTCHGDACVILATI